MGISGVRRKKAIPFSLALRLRRICSTDETFNLRAAQLTTYLLKRGYKRNFVTKQIQRAANIPRTIALQTKDVNKPTRVPFTTNFNPSLPHISNIIKKHYHLLLSSDRCKKVFPHLPVVAFRRSPNLRDLLVSAKLSSNSTNPHNSLPALIVVEKIAPLAHTFPMVLLTTPSSPPVKRVLSNLT